MRSGFSIAARHSAIDSLPGGWGGVSLTAVETTLVEEDTMVTIEAAELMVELEELPSSADMLGRDDNSETRVGGLIRLDRNVGC